MAKKHIYVGNEYAKAFESICELIRGGCFDGLGWYIQNNVINDGVYEYELSTSASKVSEAVKHAFTKDGATWFKALRGEHVENDNAIWTSFIETVGIEYHKRYSVVEYQQQARTKAEKENAFQTAKEIIDNLTQNFYPTLNKKLNLVEVADEEVIEDIYGVAMRIELSGGTGASLPILGKVYFNKSGRVMTPIKGVAAEDIDSNLNEIIPEDVKENGILSGDGVIDVTLNAIDGLINDEKRNFADYLCFSDKSDKVAVNNMLAQLSHEAIELECPRVDLLYITHIKASAFVYEAHLAGSPMLKIVMGINNNLTIDCLNCNQGEKLVDRNQITYFVDGVEKTVTLNPLSGNLGLTQEEKEEIITYSDLANHFFKVVCPKTARGTGCETLKCRSQVFEVMSDGVKSFKCSDCPYPEVVYTSLSGEKRYTPDMFFAKDVMDLVDPKDELIGGVVKCKTCGRYFSISVMKNGKHCPLCMSLKNSEDSPEAKAVYRAYKGVLPLAVRLFGLFKKKYGVEDDELVLFNVGQNKYVFNKLAVREKGYIDKPRKLTR